MVSFRPPPSSSLMVSSRTARMTSSPASGPTTILLVDDHPPNLMALEAILEPLGERVLCASSGAEAVRIASNEDLALVLLDLQMPELDGLETAALLKKSERCRGVPIIIVTANEPTRAEVARGYATGAVDFLFKPLDPDVIRSKVSVFVELYQRARRARGSPVEAVDPRDRGADEDGVTQAGDESNGPHANDANDAKAAKNAKNASSASNTSTNAKTKTKTKASAKAKNERISDRLFVAASPVEQAETVDALIRFHRALIEDVDVANLEQRFVDEACALTQAAGAAFHHRVGPREANDDGLDFRTTVAGRMHAEAAALAPSLELFAQTVRSQKLTHVDDASKSPVVGIPRGVGSLVAVPVVRRNGDLEGMLVLLHDVVSAFDARDLELANVAASHAGAAFENARYYEDATEARHLAELAELELRANEARLRIAIDAAGVGTWDFNPMTGMLRWDQRMKALAGLHPDRDVDYNTFIETIHPEDRARVDGAVKRALDPQGDTRFDCEFRFVGIEDGVERWIAGRGQGVVEQGRTVRFVGATLDITARKRVEEERSVLLEREQGARTAAENASRAKDEFLATVSHELRNPLNAILGWSRVLVEEDEANAAIDRARVRKGLDVILRNSKAQVQLVEDILEVSRIVTGKLRLSTGPVDVRAVIEAAVETVRAAANAKRVTISLDIRTPADEPLTIIADEDRVQQILWNLLSNAVKFTPATGIVTVRAHVADEGNDDSIVLVVTDSGEGIAAEFLPYVFDRFRQFDGSTTRTHGGLGLGLAIVRHLAELHGGTVRAESKGLGCGAAFTVVLPKYPAKNEATEPKPHVMKTMHRDDQEAAKSVLAGRHVLILDDDADMRDLLAMILEDAGAHVVSAGTVRAAIEALEKETFDVAVSDLAMPGEDGYAFARTVREKGRTSARMARIPLVAMTAYARAEDRHAVLAGGFDRHVAKPIEPDELVKVLVELILGSSSKAS